MKIIKDKIIKRQNTRLESEGAEFLVLGNLLIQGIPSYKTYTNMPGYDVIATNPETEKLIKIQVKSRWRTNAPGFIIKNFDCDFIIVVRLNRGNKAGNAEVKTPEFFIFPKHILEPITRTKDWNKMNLKDIPNYLDFKDQWELLKKALQ